jgi:hypothetical protein
MTTEQTPASSKKMVIAVRTDMVPRVLEKTSRLEQNPSHFVNQCVEACLDAMDAPNNNSRYPIVTLWRELNNMDRHYLPLEVWKEHLQDWFYRVVRRRKPLFTDTRTAKQLEGMWNKACEQMFQPDVFRRDPEVYDDELGRWLQEAIFELNEWLKQEGGRAKRIEAELMLAAMKEDPAFYPEGAKPAPAAQVVRLPLTEKLNVLKRRHADLFSEIWRQKLELIKTSPEFKKIFDLECQLTEVQNEMDDESRESIKKMQLEKARAAKESE